jgi:AcrR family transcriptional regulator
VRLRAFKERAMIDAVDRRADITRQQILRAAAHQFALKSYSLVSLDDILAEAAVTKGAMYFHFRSKHALAVAIIDHRVMMANEAIDELIARRLSGLETLIDICYYIALEDINNLTSRAGLHLLESIGRTDRVQADYLGRWVEAFTGIVKRAIAEGDVIVDLDPGDIGRLLVSMYMGTRQTSDLDEPKRFFRDLEMALLLTLPGIVNPDRLEYLSQFIRRRTTVAINKAVAPQLDVG